MSSNWFSPHPEIKTDAVWSWTISHSCSPGVYRNIPNTVWRASLVPGKTRSEQIFCCSSALVSTDLVGADQLTPFYVTLKPCVTPNSLWWGEECRGGWGLRVEGRWMSWLFRLITYIFCKNVFFWFPVPLRSPSTSGTSKDVTKPYKHPQRHTAARTVSNSRPSKHIWNPSLHHCCVIVCPLSYFKPQMLI